MTDLGPEIFFATIPQLNARLVAEKEISAEDLARAFATRGSGTTRTALQRARAAACRNRLSAAQSSWTPRLSGGRLRSPLQGIPYGVKDLLSVAGQITTWGAKPYRAQVFDYTATVSRKSSIRWAPVLDG